MLEEEIKLDAAIEQFCKGTGVSEDELANFLRRWAAHPDYYVEFTGKVIKNLSQLNIKLFNELTEIRRYHLLNALCLAVEVAFSMKQWEYMLGREDGDWYWNGHGLFFSSLHGLIPRLNALQKHISEIEEGFTGRVIFLEGNSEHQFLQLIHLATRLVSYDRHYFVYGGKGAHKNLLYYIKDKNDKGVRVDLIFDGDSNFGSQIENLQKQVSIRKVFRFERDFEASFPPELLANAFSEYLRRFKSESSLCSPDEVRILLSSPEPLVKRLEEQYEIKISKPTLAEFLALELLRLSSRDDRVLQGAGSLTGTELSRFLRFVMDWPLEVSIEENAPTHDITFD